MDCCLPTCDKDGTKVCSSCKSVKYCSVQCQRAHWKQHKPACKAALLSSQSLPSSSSRRSTVQQQACKHGYAYTPPPDKVHSNLLILLHGLGDDERQYCQLAKQMKLPQTACVAVRGSLPLPFGLPGFAWFASFEEDGELIRPAPAETRRIDGLRKAREKLQIFIRDILCSDCSTDDEGVCYPLERIFLMGFSDGGVVALDLAANSASLGGRFGGVVSVSASVLPELLLTGQEGGTKKQISRALCETPILITHGTSDETLPLNVQRKCVEWFTRNYHLPPAKIEFDIAVNNSTGKNTDSQPSPTLPTAGTGAQNTGTSNVQLRVFNKGHSMAADKAEARARFEFFSQHLHLTSPHLANQADVYEVKAGVVDVERVSE